MQHLKSLTTVLLSVVFLTVVGCAPKEVEPDVLSVTPTDTITFKASDNSDVTLTITTNAEKWSYTAPEWVSARTEDNKLIVNAIENKDKARSGNITFTAGSANEVRIVVKQEAPAPVVEQDVLTVEPSDAIHFLASGNEDVTLTVTTNVATWDYTLPEWVTARVADNTLIINAADNDGEARNGNITFTAGEAEPVTIEVSQEARAIPAERTIKQVLYIEVNNCNPLNILEYNLLDGTPFFDAVILFAANINYNSEEDRVYLHNNPNVQALLDNSDTFIQPLREKGIKVYLGLLGNHDASGLAQLSDWGAQQWAQEVAEVCYTYGLDGVNLDDEYSKEPDLSNPWFTTRSAAAGARLAYELKVALAEKCSWPTEVSIYEYGKLYNLPEVTIDNITHTQSEFIDFIVADYGQQSYPYGDLTYSHCSGASIQLNQNRTLTENRAKSVLANGFGWCMWFAFDPSGTGGANKNLTHSMKQFNNAAKVFYNSELAEPAYVYNKIGEGEYDATPYPMN